MDRERLHNDVGCLRCSQGSVIVEIALIIPLFLLLLFAAVDFARLGQLAIQANRTAALVADNLAQSEVLSGEDFTDISLVTGKTIGSSPLAAGISYRVMAFQVHPQTGVTSLWQQGSAPGGVICGSGLPVFPALQMEAEGTADLFYFYQVDICIQPDEGFLFSGLPGLNATAVGTVVSPARTSAIRGWP